MGFRVQDFGVEGSRVINYRGLQRFFKRPFEGIYKGSMGV